MNHFQNGKNKAIAEIQNKKFNNVVWYVDLKKGISLKEKPVDESSFQKIDLPYSRSGYFKVKSRNKEYNENAVARAVAAGQIQLSDIEIAK